MSVVQALSWVAFVSGIEYMMKHSEMKRDFLLDSALALYPRIIEH